MFLALLSSWINFIGLVPHTILLRKSRLYPITDSNFRWFQGYLSNRMFLIFLKLNNQNTNLEKIKFGVPQGSVLGLLLFFAFIRNLESTAKFLDQIIFGDDTNFFYPLKDTNVSFQTVNQEPRTCQRKF